MVNVKKDADTRDVQRYEPQLSPFSVFDRFFEDAFEPFALSPFFGRRLNPLHATFPKVDITETDTEIRVTANVPGVPADRLNVEVGDDYLSISGTMEKERRDEDRGKIYRYEREFGEFRREFTLPARVNKDAIEAKAKDGVLTITLPKSEEERKTRVKVRTE